MTPSEKARGPRSGYEPGPESAGFITPVSLGCGSIFLLRNRSSTPRSRGDNETRVCGMADVAREPRVGRATGLEPQLVEVWGVWGAGSSEISLCSSLINTCAYLLVIKIGN